MWRFFTAHLTHFGGDHLRWDLLAFAVLGVAVERISRNHFLTTLLASAALVSAGVWFLQPQFMFYRGLSGIDSALFGYLLAESLRAGWRERHGFSIAVGGVALAGFSAKCLYEVFSGHTAFVDTGGEFAPVPLAHLLGLVAGALIAAARSGRRSPPVSCRSTATIHPA